MRRKSQHSFGLLFTTSIAPHFSLSFSPSCAEKHQSPVSPAGHMPLSGVHLIPCSTVRKFQRWIKYSMPPPSPSALPSSTFLSFLSLLFDVKSDSNIYSSVNQRRFSACFFPVLCTNLILFPETLYQSEEKNPFLSLFFYPRFVWKGEMQNAIMRSVAWNGGSAWLTLFVENMISLGLFSQAICVVCVVWSLFLSLPALFIYSLLYVRGHSITEALRMWGSLYKWNWVVSMFGWGSNKYLLGSLAALSIETQLNRCWESETYTKPLKAD